MKIPTFLLFSCLAGVCSSHAASFEATSKHLDLDGSIVGFVDFEGDGDKIASHLNEIWGKVLEADTGIPPIPLDMQQVIESLGFGSMKSFAMSSKKIDERMHRNLSVVQLNGEPRGIFAMAGGETFTFYAAEVAPADAAMAFSGQLDLEALKNSLLEIAVQVMGPMGEDMALSYLGMALPGTDLTYNELVITLSTRFDMVAADAEENWEATSQGIDFWIRLEGAAAVAKRLEPLLQASGFSSTETSRGKIYEIEGMEQEGLVLRLEIPGEGEDVFLYSRTEFASRIGSEGQRLKDSNDFKKLCATFPEKALGYSYSAGVKMEDAMRILDQMPEVEAYRPAIEAGIDFLVGNWMQPNATVQYRKDDVWISEQYAGYSYKEIVMIMPVSFGVGITAAMAVPAFQKVRDNAQQSAVRNHLRMIESAGMQMLLETNRESVTYREIVESGFYIDEIEPVAGESYEDLVVTEDTENLAVILENGTIVNLR